MFCVPSLPRAGTKSSWQVAVFPEPDSVQLVDGVVVLCVKNVPPPDTFVAQLLTVPVGVVAPVPVVSVTVAVQTVVAFTVTDDGVHETAVVVACVAGVQVSEKLTPETLVLLLTATSLNALVQLGADAVRRMVLLPPLN